LYKQQSEPPVEQQSHARSQEEATPSRREEDTTQQKKRGTHPKRMTTKHSNGITGTMCKSVAHGFERCIGLLFRLGGGLLE
jgi:hypothetical protein